MSNSDYSKKRLSPEEARKLIVQIIKDGGKLIYRHHILERMGQRDFSVEDIINVLLSPSMRVSPGEPHVKGWTYRCSTGRYRVVVAFTQLADGLYLITVMDLTKRN